MLESIAIALTIGAVLYQQFHIALGTLCILTGLLVVCGSIALRSVVGVLFSLLIGGSVIAGVFLVRHADHPVPRSVFGDRTFSATVLAVDRRLQDTRLIVRDHVTGYRLQLTRSDTSTGAATLLPGDRVLVRASIEAPAPFLTATNRLFDYSQYLQSKHIVGIGSRATVTPAARGSWSLSRVATIIRFRIADVFARYIAFPVDGIVAGMTVGYQGGIPDSVNELFRVTGVLHVLVLSGYNVTLLAGFLGILLHRVPFRIRTILTIAAIILLVVVSGSGVASVRAGIMGGIALLASLSLRTYDPLRALTISYLFFLVLSPTSIFFDPGFHLSFLATIFMLFGMKKIERYFAWIPQTRGVDMREVVTMAIAAPLFMLPYTMFFSGLVPLASPVANILLAVVTPTLSIAAFVVLAVAGVPPLATALGVALSAVGGVVLHILAWAATLPAGNTPPVSGVVVVGSYLGIYGVLFRRELTQYYWRQRNFFLPASNSSG